MRITTGSRLCRRCGATIPPDAPQQSCGACLLETGLGAFEPDDGVDVDPTPEPMLMDFGDYELLEQIGRGGQGVVFRARQKSLNRTVALKVIALGHWATEGHIKRFRLEAEAAASLDHPHIVPIYDVGERNGSCYFSMKFVEGGQLDSVARREPVPIRRAVELIAKLARTVQYAHERGILHRDIKPGNILLDGNGEPNLTDFGLARLVETESNVTRTMEVLGTPSYMAPEEAAGQTKQLTAATDVYGLGAVFYQLLTGHPPFAGGTTYETIRLVLETEPRKPRLWNPKVDVDLETICLKCLEKEPPRRYPSALVLAEDLERWLRHEPIQARRTGVFKRAGKWARRNPAVAALVAIIITLAIAIGGMMWRTLGEQLPASGLAVLPFENLSDDKSDTSFADGVQDDILTKLAKLADLKVISRTSVMQYRGERNLRKIGRALRVSHVLEGSVRRAGDKIHFNAQLIDARNDTHVWAEQYDRGLNDVFAVQSEIAQTVASQLKSKVSTAEKTAIEARPTRDLEAYRLYLQAKDLTIYLTPDSPASFERVTQAVELLEKAVERDPNFVLAYCLLTQTNLSLYWSDNRSDTSRRARAEAALRAAQRIAPDAGETHLAHAFFYYHGSRDYDHALEQLDIASRLLPNSADVFYASALIERRLGRWGEALRHFSKANEVNPRDPLALTQVIVTHTFLRYYAEADQVTDRAIATFPEAADHFWNLKGRLKLEQGDLEHAHAAAEKAGNNFPALRFWVFYYKHNFVEAEAVSLSIWQGKDIAFARNFALYSAIAARAAGATDRMRSYLLAARQSYEPLLVSEPDPGDLSWVGVIDAALGRNEQAIAECRRAVELQPISHDALEGLEYVKNLALVYAWAGERDRAIEQLSALVKLSHGPTVGELKFDPMWDALRDDPRFTQIMSEATKPIPLQ